LFFSSPGSGYFSDSLPAGFGCPKVGGHAFYRHLISLIESGALSALRIEHPGDPVPHLPPNNMRALRTLGCIFCFDDDDHFFYTQGPEVSPGQGIPLRLGLMSPPALDHYAGLTPLDNFNKDGLLWMRTNYFLQTYKCGPLSGDPQESLSVAGISIRDHERLFVFLILSSLSSTQCFWGRNGQMIHML
jgi:hypothetical protein